MDVNLKHLLGIYIVLVLGTVDSLESNTFCTQNSNKGSCSVLAQDDPLGLLASSSLHAVEGDAEYIDDVEIKGILTSHWRKCSSWLIGINFTMDIYITENEVYWNMPSVLPFVPVRVELTGQMWENGVVAPIHHVYDYIKFEQFEGDKYNAAFEPPAGVLCPGLKQEVPIPEMPNYLSYSRESTVSNQNYIELETVFYDTIDKVSRTDYFDGVSEIHLIRDFNEGVLYKINVKADSCEILPMTPNEVPKNGTSTELNWQYVLDTNGYVQMKTVKDYFLLGGNFTYEGEHLVRGVTCDLYSHKVSNYKNSIGWTLIGLYFSKANIQMYNTRGSVEFMKNQLMQVTVENDKVITTSDIYNVDLQPMPEKSPYDVSMCFSASSQMPFIIYFEVEGPLGTPELELQDIYRFMKLAVQQIAIVANVSSFRVHLDDISWDNNPISLQGKILDVPAAYVRYIKRPGKKQDSSVLPSSLQAIVQTQPGLSASACAAYCSKDTSLVPVPEAVSALSTCDSFDVCINSGSCFFYQQFNNSKFRKLVDDGDCDHFQKSTSNPKPTPLVESWSRLREAVYREQLEITLTKSNDSSTLAVFSGEGIINLNPASEDLEQPDASLYDYDEIPGIQLYDPVVQKDISTIDDCARLCSNTLNFQCLSFVYCMKRQTCALHDVTFSERMGYIKTLNCNTYSRSYIKDFEQVSDTSILSSSDTVIQNIDDKEQCAYLCLNNTDFLCESFELCVESGVGICYLGNVHIYDLPRDDTQKNEDCEHYSRNYATDFDEIPNKVTNYAVDRTISGVTVAQCAWICSTETSYNCSIFQFCEVQGQCQLISYATKHVTVSFIDMDSCSIFTKKKVSGVKKSGNGEKSRSSGYSEGTMAGIGVGMTSLGAGLAIVGMLIFARVHRRGTSGTDASELTMDEITDDSQS